MSDAREALARVIFDAGARCGSANALCPCEEWEQSPMCRVIVRGYSDAILAAGWTPPGARVKPSVEDVARVLYERMRQTTPGGRNFPSWDPESRHAEPWLGDARAALDLTPGRTETEVKAEALRDAAQDARLCWTGTTNLRDQDDPEKAYSFDRWLDVRADHIEHRGA